MQKDHTYFMGEALKEAKKALEEGEVPVGAVMVLNNRIIARAFNQVEKLNDATAHAEILAITAASATLQSKYLPECILYLTLEPCPMCAGAMFWSQLGALVYGANDPKRGCTNLAKPLLHKKTTVVKGVLAKESADLLKGFFQDKRK